MKKHIALVALVAIASSLIVGCGSSPKESVPAAKIQVKSYKDGTYVGKSRPDEVGAVGEVTLVIEKGKIAKADFKGLMKDGKVKDADYGKTNGAVENPAYYNKAQNAVRAFAAYGPKLVETQDVSKVDAISGATIAYNQFNEAVKAALEKAKE